LLILHAAFSSPVLWVWGEGEGGGPEPAKRRGRPPKTPSPAPHPFSATATLLAEAAAAGGATLEGTRALSAVAWLPTSAEKPLPSSPVLGELLDDPAPVKLTAWGVSALPMGGRAMVEWLAACLGKTSLAPGVLLGTQAAFRRHFFLPIQTASDPVAARRLKRITGPFILRRLKTDRAVIKDLPEKQEMKVFCTLTKEQASLYQAVLDDVSRELSKASGIQRKGLVLSTLLRLKQACNHPAHLLGDRSPLRGRSGKLARLEEMLEEVLAAGDKALVFTQFTEMGTLLQRYLQETFGREVLFLHGGTPRGRRDAMVERFQRREGPPFFLLSLKAGGTGLNLTAASHVFHFDRWWNPAVENQATDRAFRIGQKNNVQVHTFLCAGTLEEKIDAMIERKKAVAQSVVGTGETWLTELNNDELRALLALEPGAVAE